MRWCRIRLVLLGLTLCVLDVVSGTCKQSPNQLAKSIIISDVVVEAKVFSVTEDARSDPNRVNFNISVQLKKDLFKGKDSFKNHWNKNKLTLRIFSDESKKECLTSMKINKNYYFFLMDNGDRSGIHFGLSAAPAQKLKSATRVVMKELKPEEQTTGDTQTSKPKNSGNKKPNKKKPGDKKKPEEEKTPSGEKGRDEEKKPGKKGKKKPVITEIQGPATLQGNEPLVTIWCNATGKPTPIIKWYKDGGLVEPTPSHWKVNNTKNKNVTTMVVISNPTHKDSGVYTCEASNLAGKVSKNITLNVAKTGKPVIKKLHGPGVVHRNATLVTIWCEAKGTPSPTIAWYKDGTLVEEIPSHWTVTNSSNLDVVKVTLGIQSPSYSTDAGVYTCEASNSEGTDIKNFTLDGRSKLCCNN